jgi:tetratricopeptide (TPR) repeat protein
MQIVGGCKISVKYGLDSLLGDVELQLGAICEASNNYSDRIEHYFKALESFSRSENTRGIVISYINLGRTAYNAGKYSLSLAYFKQAERFTGLMDDYDLFTRIKLYNYLMLVCASLGNTSDSIHYADILSGYMELINDTRELFRMITGEVLSVVSDQSHDEIIDKYGKTLDIMSYMDNANLLSMIRSNIGIIYSSIQGKDSIESLSNIVGTGKTPKGRASALDLISSACSYMACMKYDKALDAAKCLLNMCIYEKDITYEPAAYGIMYRAYFLKEDFIRAEECIRECAAVFERTDRARHFSDCCKLMGEFYMHINREKEAVDCILKAIEENEKSRCRVSKTWY